jgi:hypothetical protein
LELEHFLKQRVIDDDDGDDDDDDDDDDSDTILPPDSSLVFYLVLISSPFLFFFQLAGLDEPVSLQMDLKDQRKNYISVGIISLCLFVFFRPLPLF